MFSARSAFRRLAHAPGFTALAVLTLALGIGASTALFSVVNGVLLRPLAYQQPSALVWLRESMPVFGPSPLPISAHHFVTWRQRVTTFTALSVVDSRTISLTGRDRPQQLALSAVSANFFDLLGIQPAQGRTFVATEEQDGANRVVILSDALWRREFGADPAIVGSTIQLDHEPHTVLGVLPPRFPHPHVNPGGPGSVGPGNPDLYRPKVFSAEELAEKVGRHNYGAIGRLKPGVSLEQATAELNQIEADILREAGAGDLILRAQATPLHEAIVHHSRQGLLVLFGAVTSVLLIGCVNLMNFLLARAEIRRHEAAVRQALGASPRRLLAEALAEALLVAALGGLAGVGVAKLGLTLLLRHVPTDLPRLGEVGLDLPVLAFALGTTLLTGLLFGAVPAWRLAHADPQQALASGRTVAGAGSRRLAGLLISAEVALGLLLLMTAALLGTSFARLLRTDKGFRATAVLSGEVVIPVTKYSEEAQRIAFFDTALARLSALPGVTAAAITNALPMQGETWIDKAAVAGDTRPLEEKPNTNVRFVNGDYFGTLGVPLRGRAFDASDRQRKVAIVSQTLADLLWPGQDPIGRRVERWAGDEYEVIGVAGNVRVAADRAPVPTLYRPHWDWPPHRMIVAIRTIGDPRAAASSFRAAIRSIDPDVPVPTLQTLQEVTAGSLAQQRFQTLLAAAFAAAAVLLTALGIFGVVAHSVSRRRKELGIRLALGAAPSSLRALVVRQSMRPVWCGLLLGGVAAVGAARVLRSLLFETSPTDPLLLASVTTVLALVAALACYLPGRRATAVDPVETLRAE